MKPQQVIPPLKRIAPKPIEVEPAAARDQDPLSARPAVVNALQVVAPAPVLVDLVEEPEAAGRQLTLQDSLAMLGDVPVQVGLPRAGKAQGERRLADLARSGDEDHFPGEIPADLVGKIARARGHGRSLLCFSPTVKITSECFCPRVK